MCCKTICLFYESEDTTYFVIFKKLECLWNAPKIGQKGGTTTRDCIFGFFINM
jgi:hypothetical protein